MRPIIVTVGPSAADNTRSTLVRMDEWAGPNIAIQCTVSGTVNYTIQSSLDDPNDPSQPVAEASMTWVNSADAAAVGATGTIQTNYFFVPRFISLFKNSGNGTVTMTVLQSGVTPL